MPADLPSKQTTGSRDSLAYEVIDRLAEEFVTRLRQGEQPSLEEFVARYPDLAEDIRELLPTLLEMEQVKVEASPVVSGGTSVPATTPLSRLGDYHLLREVGRGGMGVVYEAEQISLGRRVALKILPRHLFPNEQQKRRFEREARAAARLHHTNIVPIFGIGEHEGMPYYVMQLIQGQPLDQVIDELVRLGGPGAPSAPVTQDTPEPLSRAATVSDLALALRTGQFQPLAATSDSQPTPEPEATAPQSSPSLPSHSGTSSLSAGGKHRSYWQNVARIGLEVAGALDHAHQKGIQHRDIKPGNLLLDAGGTVWVTDFGLAKAEGMDNLTHTGDILGTLRYMPPEAFEGRTDVRSDVYSLGLTLYEMLTLRPAFDERERNRLLRQVTQSSPSSLRRINPSIPRDLATIVTKAIDRDPSRRYPTAAALAEDLRRFLNDQPVRARPIGMLEHGWRWCLRNPGHSRLMLALCMAVMLGIGGLLWGLSAARQGEEKASQQRVIAQENENKANRFATAAQQAAADALRTAAELRTERDEVLRLNSLREAELYRSDMNRVGALIQAGNALAANAVLQRHVPKDGGPDRRGFEWYYHRRVANLEAHVVPIARVKVHRLEFSPDGKLMGLCGYIHTNPAAGIAQVRTSDGKELVKDLFRPNHFTQMVRFSPDGAVAVVVDAADGWDARTSFLRVFTVANWELLKEVTINGGIAHEVVFSPTEKRLFGIVGDGSLRAWDTETWKEAEVLRGHWGHGTGIALDAAGTRLVTAAKGDRFRRLWVRGMNQPQAFPLGGASQEPSNMLAFRQDGKQLVEVTWDGEVKFWNVAGPTPIYLFSKFTGKSLAYSPDGKTLAVGTNDGVIRLYDAYTGEEITVLRGHSEAVFSVAYHRDGKLLASGGEDGTLRLWDLESITESRVLRGFNDAVHTVTISPDGQTVVAGGGSRDPSLRVWNASTGELQHTARAHTDQIRRVRFLADGKSFVSGSFDTLVKIWDAAEVKTLKTIRVHSPAFWGFSDLAIPTDGKHLYSCGADLRMLRVTDLATGKVIRSFENPRSGYLRADVSRDGAVTAAVTWVTDGQTVTVVWDANTGKELFRTRMTPTNESAVRFSPDGQRVAISQQGGVVLLLDTRSGQLLRELRGHTAGVLGLAFDPTGLRLATGSHDRTIRLWDVPSGEELLLLRGHTNWVYDLQFSNDGTRLVSCSADRTVRI